MTRRALFLPVALLADLAVLTTPAFLNPLVSHTPEPVATVSPTATPLPTATATPDPFAGVPTATPLGRQSAGTHILPTLSPVAASTSLAAQPPTNTPTAAIFLPDTSVTVAQDTPAIAALPPVPTPAGDIPMRIVIPRLSLDAPIEPVGMVPSPAAPGVFEWVVPDHRAAGWLNTSAPFGKAGNTVLDGHHTTSTGRLATGWRLRQ